MSLAKKVLLRGSPVLAIGGVGTWMWMNGFGSSREQRKVANVSLSLGRFRKSQTTKRPDNLKTSSEILQVAKLERGNESLDVVQEPQEPAKEEEDMDTDNNVVINDPKAQIGEAGLDCGEANRETECTILDGGLNVDIDGNKRDNYEIIDGDNGKFKFRVSDDQIFKNGFRFIITEKPIKLKNKADSSQTITLDRYENYGLEKDESSGKVYLTRKLKADEGKIRSLGLPGFCTLPTDSTQNPPCKLLASQVKSINFEGKKNGGATTIKPVDLYLQKVSDETTYKGGYKFTFKPEADVDINTNDKIKAGVFKDFKLKNPEEDDLVLEKVWKDENQLLGKFGLNCDEKGKCTINDGFLKIKDNKRHITIEDGRRKSGGGNGNIYIEKRNVAGYYEGLEFIVWGEKITIESKANPASSLEMEELGIYHIVKEEKNGNTSYYLTRDTKNSVDDVLKVYLGLWSCPPRDGYKRTGEGDKSHMTLYKFHDGDGERRVTFDAKNNSKVTMVITSTKSANYPFGYKLSIKPEKEIKIGKITLEAGKENNFKIKRDEKERKLYLVEDK